MMKSRNTAPQGGAVSEHSGQTSGVFGGMAQPRRTSEEEFDFEQDRASCAVVGGVGFVPRDPDNITDFVEEDLGHLRNTLGVPEEEPEAGIK